MTRVRLHTTISKDVEEKIKNLENRFGTKSKVVEMAVSALEKAETVGSCDDCALKEEYSYRIVLDLISVREEMLESLIDIISGGRDFQSFFNGIRERAKEEAFLLSQAINFKKRNDFQNMVKYLRIWEKLSNHYTILQVFDSEQVVLMRIRSFRKIPEIVIEIIRGHLEGLDLTFELDLGLDNLLKVKWLSPELARISRVTREMDKRLNVRHEDLLKKIKTHTFIKNMIPVSSELFNYLAEKCKNEMIPIEVGQNEVNYIRDFNIEDVKEGNELDIIKKILTYYEGYNYLTILNLSQENNKIIISYKCRTKSVLDLLTQIITVVVTKVNLKLVEMEFDQNSVVLNFKRVKKDDQNTLNTLFKRYFPSDLANDVIANIVVPRELLRKINTELENKNPKIFKEIYKLTGMEIANGVSLYCKKKDLNFIDMAVKWISQYLESEDRMINVKDNTITIFYLSIDNSTMESHKYLIEGLFSKISKKIKVGLFENMLKIEL